MNPSDFATLRSLAESMSRRSTCPKGRVGAVVSPDSGKYGRNVSVGWNGAPAGMPTCETIGCRDEGQSDGPTHVHAEARALLRAGSRSSGGILLVTQRPCHRCQSFAWDVGIHRIYYLVGDSALYIDNPTIDPFSIVPCGTAGIKSEFVHMLEQKEAETRANLRARRFASR